MANPIESASELKRLLVAVLETFTMAQKPRDTILSALSKTDEIIKDLEEIQNNLFPLEIKSNNSNLSTNLAFWQKATAGNLKSGSDEYNKLISNSETLKALYRAGIDIPTITKFSGDEIKFAKEIGVGFSEFHELLHQLNVCINQNIKNKFQIVSKVEKAQTDERFFNLLKKYNVIDDYKVHMYVKQKGGYTDSSFPQCMKSLAKKNSVRINCTFSNSNYHNLISGHWFNAYAYYIIDDHLNRNKFDYELYTRVSYKAPEEIFRSGGDFDVIAMVGQKVLLVECKSNELRADRDDFDKIIQKTKGIKKVFDLTRTNHYEYIFLLIYNHFSNNHQEISTQLEGTGIKPIRPNEIRGTVIELFKKEM